MKHFFSKFVYTSQTKNDTSMSNTLKISNGGGYKPAPDMIKIRVRYYVETRFHRPLSNLRYEQRLAVIYCLHQQFEFSSGAIASLLSCSNSTVFRGLQATQVYKNSSEFMSIVRNIEDYILYNAKYIH